MKNSSPLIKALVVAGMVGTMAHISPVANAAPLTTAQIKTLTDATTAPLLVAAATAILNAAPLAEKEQVAKDMAKYVAATKSPAAAAQVVKYLVGAVPASAQAIVQAAIAAYSGIVAELRAQLPAALVDAAVAANAAQNNPNQNTQTTTNPNTNSTN